jgi:hypothetical protein
MQNDDTVRLNQTRLGVQPDFGSEGFDVGLAKQPARQAGIVIALDSA